MLTQQQMSIFFKRMPLFEVGRFLAKGVQPLFARAQPSIPRSPGFSVPLQPGFHGANTVRGLPRQGRRGPERSCWGSLESGVMPDPGSLAP